MVRRPREGDRLNYFTLDTVLDEPIFPFLAFGLGEPLVLVQCRWLPLGRPAAPLRDLFFVGSSMAPPRSFVLGAFSVPSCVLASPATSHRNRRFTRRARLSPGNRRASALRRHSVFLLDRDPWLGHRCLTERLSEVPLHQLRSQLPGSPGRDSVAASAVFGFFYVGGSRRSIRHGGSGFCSCSLSSLVAPTFVSHQPLRSLGAYSWPS